ncbi:monofunctional biosynthetic peptidoglycan transglycosylase [Thiovibrio sp. JS02]
MQVVPENATGVLPPVSLPLRLAGISFRFRSLRALLLKWLFFFLAGSIALTAFFRWAPVPFSSLMVQRQFAAAANSQKHYQQRYEWVSLEKMSLHAPLAVIAAEDQKFLDHQGFDLEAINKAWQANQRRKNPRGASTITQQVAKNLFLWPGKSFLRKGIEAYFTVLLEGLWSKQRILEVYLNVAEFGPGIFGIEAASQAYFHKSAAKLNAAEAAILAAILPSPLRSSVRQPSGYITNRAWHIQKQMRLLGGTGYVRPLVTPRG